MTSPRRAAVLGGNRIPFARQFGAYAEASNQDMLTAALDGLVDRYGLAGERLGEVVAGAVLKHSRDFNLTREAVLGSSLSPETPAYDVTQACGTGLEAAILVANKIALGQIDVRHRRRRRHDLRRPDRREREAAPQAAADATARRARPTRRWRRWRSGRPTSASQVPANAEPRTGLSMGEHMAITAERVGHHPRGPGRAGPGQPPEPRRRLRPRLLRRPGHAVPRARPRPEPARRLDPGEARRRSSPSSAGEGGTMTAGNSTPLTDGASAVLLGLGGVGGRARAEAAGAGSSTPRPPRSTTSPATRAC